MKYFIRDFWNLNRKVEWDFDHEPVVGSIFQHQDVEYKIVRSLRLVGKPIVLIARMFRYKLANTSTTFVHKCPAKKQAAEKLSRDDQISLEAKHGKEKFAKIMNSRVKIRSLGAQTQFQCPYCKTIFWKEHFELPATVQVGGVLGKKVLRKRN